MPVGFAKTPSVCLLQWNDGPGAKPRSQGRGWARGLAPDAAESRARGRGRGPPPAQEQVRQGRNDSPGLVAGAGLRSDGLCPLGRGRLGGPRPRHGPGEAGAQAPLSRGHAGERVLETARLGLGSRCWWPGRGFQSPPPQGHWG